QCEGFETRVDRGNPIDGSANGLDLGRARRSHDDRHTRDWYSPVSVLTRTLSPSLTNEGTLMTRPVSSVAGLTCALAVAPLMPGTVSFTTQPPVGGRPI